MKERIKSSEDKPMILDGVTVNCFDCDKPVTRIYPVRRGKSQVYVCIECESKNGGRK